MIPDRSRLPACMKYRDYRPDGIPTTVPSIPSCAAPSSSRPRTIPPRFDPTSCMEACRFLKRQKFCRQPLTRAGVFLSYGEERGNACRRASIVRSCVSQHLVCDLRHRRAASHVAERRSHVGIQDRRHHHRRHSLRPRSSSSPSSSSSACGRESRTVSVNGATGGEAGGRGERVKRDHRGLHG